MANGQLIERVDWTEVAEVSSIGFSSSRWKDAATDEHQVAQTKLIFALDKEWCTGLKVILIYCLYFVCYSSWRSLTGYTSAACTLLLLLILVTWSHWATHKPERISPAFCQNLVLCPCLVRRTQGFPSGPICIVCYFRRSEYFQSSYHPRSRKRFLLPLCCSCFVLIVGHTSDQL